jgi:hypothetical protein
MREMQLKTDQREANLRNSSTSAVSMISSLNSGLKLNALLIKLSTYLDTVAEFL